MTSGMIVTSGATPARPMPLSARAPTVPETIAPWLPMLPLSMSGLLVYQFQPWQSPRLPLPSVSVVPHGSAGFTHSEPARSGWSESKPESMTATTMPPPRETSQASGASVSASATTGLWVGALDPVFSRCQPWLRPSGSLTPPNSGTDADGSTAPTPSTAARSRGTSASVATSARPSLSGCALTTPSTAERPASTSSSRPPSAAATT